MSKWKWANDILYSMCKTKPEHKEDEVILGKICLIGRATAAAIERRREDYVEEGEDFYLKRLRRWLAPLQSIHGLIELDILNT